MESTLDSLQKLRARVAELLGWKSWQEQSPYMKEIMLTYYLSPEGEKHASPWPDYCNDLNACASFEEKMKTTARYRYVCKLAVISGTANLENLDEAWSTITATAEQRCQAFVAVMEGK